MALDIAQVDPGEVAYIDDQELFVEVAQSLGIRGICHTDYNSTRTALVTLEGSRSLKAEERQRESGAELGKIEI